jgi:dTDP-4-amino-4,6-dideoxygalactose transaminase
MPAFTFAATAHAALWAGLTPLFCDIDPDTWLPSHDAEEELLHAYGAEIAVIVTCTTFGASLDLDRYAAVSARYGVPVVVDAAGALGALDCRGRPFGAGSPFPIVFSMHATKTFAVGEGGVIYADNPILMPTLRAMGNFGFGEARSATTIGLNSKLSEVSALLALAKLDQFEQVLTHRAARLEQYRDALPDWTFQQQTGQRQPVQFVSVVPPEGCSRDHVRAALTRDDIGSGAYFSPHLAEQPYFRTAAVAGDLWHTDRLAARVIALPMSDTLSVADVDRVCEVLRDSVHTAGGEVTSVGYRQPAAAPVEA